MALFLSCCLSTFTTNATSQLDVFWHDCHSLGVDGAQVGIFKKTHQVGFTCFLQRRHSWALESQISFEVLSDFTNQTLEGQLSDQKFSALLVTSDFTQSNSSWSVSVWLLHTTSSWSRFPGSFSSQLLPGSFSTSGFSCSLFRTSHCRIECDRLFVQMSLFIYRTHFLAT